ncbi:probable glutathione S-transferase [Chenopodium quinoa]|uniref:probable glutathione S-transferase n=1 Tax=Chenopodium quinoa TaxID=63459 RepID=UPI000B7721A0|nr:probable glutathione S-transferase [Chenopodium quinoa]
MPDELVLLDQWASPFALRVNIALQEKGITNYVSQYENLHAKSSLLLDMNPVHNQVPVLIHDGKPVCESLVILEYIDEVWNDKSCNLLPADPYERARARFLADYFDITFSTFLSKIWTQKEVIEYDEKKDFINFLKLFEEELADEPYFGGNNFGYLDVALIPNYNYICTYGMFTKLDILAECPKLNAWAKICMERNSVKKYVPNELKIYEYVHEIRKRLLGID